MANTAVRPTEAKEVSWQQFGKNFDRPVTIDEAIKIAGLDYDVETAPLLRVPNEVIESIEVIHEENYVIGRQAQLQNYITNSGVSRRHVEIVKENDEFYVRDLKSKNGTRINNIRMASGEQKKLNNNEVNLRLRGYDKDSLGDKD